MEQTSDMIADRGQRSLVAYKELLAAGWPKEVALTLVAMSAIETNALLLITRVNPLIFPADSCYPTCVRCALEADFNNTPNGLVDVSSEGIVIDPAWYGDPKGMQILQASLSIVPSRTDPSYWVHPIDYSVEWNQSNQLAFEYALTQQNGSLLKQWDMGPMFLRCAGMGPVATAIGRPPVGGFPASWNEMFDLYTSTSYNDAFTKGAIWYQPPYYTGIYPGSDPGNQQLAASFAGRQLGQAADSDAAQTYAILMVGVMQTLNSSS